MLGIVFGIVMARAMAGYIGGFLEDIYGVAQRAGDISLDPKLVGGGGGDGRDHEPGRGGDSRAQRRARRSGEGVAEGQIPIA